MSKLHFIIVLNFIIYISLFSQKEDNNWYFGTGAAITFNNMKEYPISLIESKMYESSGCATFSDINGNLLFYTDGKFIWNKSHNYMSNDSISGNRPMVIPKPGYPSQYYLFTLSWDYFKFSDSHFLQYSIIDMKLNNGLGNVSRSVVLDSGIAMFTCVNHKNGKDVWIICYDRIEDIFRTYLLTKNGFEQKQQTQPLNLYKEFLWHALRMTASPNGDRIFIPLGHNSHLFSFDNNSGSILFLVTLDSTHICDSIYDKCYGPLSGEFSANGKVLYFSELDSIPTIPSSPDVTISQFNLDFIDFQEIVKSRKVIFADSTHHMGSSLFLRRGPDKKIYSTFGSLISSIDSPDSLGNACNFKMGSVKLLKGRTNTFFQNILPCFYCFSAMVNSPICYGDTIFLSANLSPKFISPEFFWTGPNGFTSILQNPSIINADFNHTGTYNLTVIADTTILYDSVVVQVYPLPVAKIVPNGMTRICDKGSLVLKSKENDKTFIYEWSTGEKKQNMTITKPGTYYLTVSTPSGCSSTDSIFIDGIIDLKIQTNGIKSICSGDTVILSTEPHNTNYSYLWSTGEITPAIKANKSGLYKVIVSYFECKDSAVIKLDSFPKPIAKIDGNSIICDGDSTILSARPIGYEFSYRWSNNDSAMSIVVNTSGRYWLIVENQYGCKDSAYIDVQVLPQIISKIIGNQKLCKGFSIVLTAEPIGSSYKYLWSTGDTSQVINIDKPGKYWVKITLNDKCTDTAFIDVVEVPIPQFSITGDSLLCPGRTSILLVPNDFQSYLWNTGDTTKSISVSQPSDYTVTVTDTNGCSGTASFEVIQYDIKLTGLTNLDFVSRQAGGSYPLNFTLKNESNAPILIKSVTTKNLSSIFNITTNPPLTEPLDVGSNIDITVTFKPDLNQYYSDSLILVIDAPCPDTLSSYLSGTSKALTTIFIPDLTAIVGTPDFCIPLMAKKDANMQIIDNLSYTAEISYDVTALVPNDSYSIESGDRVITLSGNNIKFINNEIELGNFCGDVVLANKDITPLRITQFKWDNSNIDTITQNGSLTMQGLCQRGIARIEIFIPVEFSFKQSIVSNELEISTKNATNEDILTIYSIIGIEMGSYFCSEQMSIDLSGLASGVYFVRIGENVGKFVKF